MSDQLPPLNLCRFEVATHVGRHTRLGAYIDGRIIDLNFAAAWYLAQTGESEPQRLADALVPSDMICFLRSGLRAVHTAEDLISGAGPNPPGWWRLDENAPRGPNGETLAYRPQEVRLLAPIPGRNIVGPEAAAAVREWRPGFAAVIAAWGVAGFTGVGDFGPIRAVGPYITRPGDLAPSIGAAPRLAMTAKLNGDVKGRFVFDADAKYIGMPGDMVDIPSDIALTVAPGDQVELELDRMGALRNRIE